LILRHLLIDWLTLRVPLDERLSLVVREKVLSCLGRIQCYDPDGVLSWEKNTLDVDKLRSDTVGLLWQVQSDGKQQFLVIAGSPAAVTNGLNVFGSLDIRAGAAALIRVGCRALRSVLPALEHWQCRRIDITGNYGLPDSASVKDALRTLMISDGARRHASTPKSGGDSVGWNCGSDISKGKAYHKGPQLRYLVKKGKVSATEEQLTAADQLLRLEHTKGSRWWRRFEQKGGKWWQLTAWELWQEFKEFFGRLVQGVEVKDMDRVTMIKAIQDANGITEGRAASAFKTLKDIREDGFQVVRDYTPPRTWYRHLKYLRAAGITDADMTTAKQAANVLPFRMVRIVLAQPVGSWEDIRRAA
jgi:II/X family phage/plasmid replication protein